MATNFPTSVDALTNPVSNDSLNSPSHSAQHANANDAIEAIEGYLLTGAGASGLVKLIPTSATNATVAANGDVTIGSAVSSVIINGAFTSAYEAYKIVISNVTMSSTISGTSIFMRMYSGSPVGANYNYGIPRVDLATGSVSSYFAAAGTNGILIGTGTGDKFGTNFDVTNPFLATHTIFTGISVSQITTGYTGAGAGMHQASTSYADFDIRPSTGTLTGGTIRIYGYK